MTGNARWLVAGITAALLAAAGVVFFFFGSSFDSALRVADRQLARVGTERVAEAPEPFHEVRPAVRNTPAPPQSQPGFMQRISGHLVGMDGSPVGGARIVAYPLVPGLDEDGYYDDGKSRPDGSFGLSGLPNKGTMVLRVDMDGYSSVPESPEEGRVELADADVTGLDVVVGKTLSLSGIVVDRESNPIAFVWVVMRRINDIAADPPNGGESAEDGSITIGRLDPGEYELAFTKDGTISSVKPEPQRILIVRGESLTGIHIMCPDETLARRSISGVVTDRAGASVADAEIWAKGDTRDSISNFGRYPEGQRICRTDLHGRYSGALPYGAKEVFAQHRYYSDSTHLKIAEERTVANFVLPPMSAVAGWVVDARTGEPVTEFRVRAGIGMNRDDEYTIVRDPNGRFALDKVKAGAVTVSVVARGYADGKVEPGIIVPGETRGNVEVRLTPGGAVEGHVVDSEGRPVRLARIRVEGIRNARASDVSNDDGYFFLETVPAGTAQIVVEHDTLTSVTTSVNIVPGVYNDVRLVLPAGADVRGRVSSGDAPINSGQVFATWQRGKQSRNVALGRDGNFVISGIPNGPVEIRVIAEVAGSTVHATRKIDIVQGKAPEVIVDLDAPTAHIAGTVSFEPGSEAAAPTQIEAHTLSESDEPIVTVSKIESDGRFALSVVPGKVRLSVSDGNGNTKWAHVDAKAGETVKQDIRLFGDPTLYLDIQLSAESPRPTVYLLNGAVEIHGITIELMKSIPALLAATARIDSDGQGAFKALDPGTYTVFAYISEGNVVVISDTNQRWASKVVEIGTEDEVISLDMSQ